jgi:glycosyltransferase involved in cell wall biosynthesis
LKTYPAILFLDQSGELGGAELCLADLAQFCAESSAVLLFQEGPFAEFLRARKLAVHVALLPQTATRVSKAASLLAYLKAIPGMSFLIYRTLKIAKDYDLLYANTAKALIVGGLLAFLLRKKFCFHLHDIVSAEHFSALNRRLIVLLANRADLVVANSVATAKAFIAGGGKKHLVKVIPNGFDLSRFRRSVKEESQELPDGVPAGRLAPCVGVFGRITRWKGQDVLLRALAKLPGVHGLIVGEALFTGDDRAFAGELRNLAAELGIADRIHFTGFRPDIVPLLLSLVTRELTGAVGAFNRLKKHLLIAGDGPDRKPLERLAGPTIRFLGRLGDNEIKSHLERCRALIFPGWEDFGIALVEAQACGKPLIAFAAGRALETVIPEQTGLLFRERTEESLA